eukprot:c45541_g1_i1 orf=3-230(-)
MRDAFRPFDVCNSTHGALLVMLSNWANAHPHYHSLHAWMVVVSIFTGRGVDNNMTMPFLYTFPCGKGGCSIQHHEL